MNSEEDVKSLLRRQQPVDWSEGFITFAPEWLTGNPNLDTSNFMYLWVYLFFFNTLWVWIPLWVLYEAYNSIGATFGRVEAKIYTGEKKRA